MANVFDIAHYLLRKCGQMSHMKLQKLVYYSQAWHLVWEDAPIFKERIEAWANGPVVPDLFHHLKGKFLVNSASVKPKISGQQLSKEEKITIDEIIDFYAKHDSQWLSDLTHMEMPWQKARRGVADGKRSSNLITRASMSEYYSSLK